MEHSVLLYESFRLFHDMIPHYFSIPFEFENQFECSKHRRKIASIVEKHLMNTGFLSVRKHAHTNMNICKYVQTNERMYVFC